MQKETAAAFLCLWAFLKRRTYKAFPKIGNSNKKLITLKHLKKRTIFLANNVHVSLVML